MDGGCRGGAGGAPSRKGIPVWERTRAVVMVSLLAGCAELEAEPLVTGPSGAGPGAGGSTASSPGGAAAIGCAASSQGGAAAPSQGEAGPLARTSTPCLDGVEPRDDAVMPVVLPGSAGASGFDVDGEPSTGITVFDRSGSMFAPWSTAELPEGEATDAQFTDKWAAASEALIASILPVQHRVTIGALLFPLPGGCEVAPLSPPPAVRTPLRPRFRSPERAAPGAGSMPGSGTTPPPPKGSLMHFAHPVARPANIDGATLRAPLIAAGILRPALRHGLTPSRSRGPRPELDEIGRAAAARRIARGGWDVDLEAEFAADRGGRR